MTRSAVRTLGVVTAALIGISAAVAAKTPAPRPQSGPQSGTLDIYFIDVEGGQSTLLVTPTKESMLIDAGFAGDGTFNSKPGDPAVARDPQRILAAARDAGIARIDHLLVTHFHADHFGGVMELSQLLPIREFIDHGPPSAAADSAVPGTMALYEAYAAVRAKAVHRQPKAGERLQFGGIIADVLASDGTTLRTSLDGGPRVANSACTSGGVPAQEKLENPNSTAVRVQFGKFRFLDVGDLSGPPLYALTCPDNLIAQADVYLIAHHGGADGSDPSLFAAVKPRIAIFNNGARKGAQEPTLTALRSFGIEGWQLHKTANPGAVNNADAHIANLDQSTSAWIKLSARADGSFVVTNGRTGERTTYPAPAR
ncbi:ComEC/Rec2 family competence protein [Gemmatimonas sp.]|uniref:ComEC/Rec2 family competence protein n=1 Tax=Gemmatimonas sp. TaxID=1962908 RepID=UPI0027BA42A8|nr:MBL fold metallo-hydrolase [Gemmatimonas sp.]